jgi:hypothetical protein
MNSLAVRLFPPRFEAFVRGREVLIIFGFVMYRDVITSGQEAEHESRFRMECHFPGYTVAPNGEVVFDEPLYFAFMGPDAYNRCT